jgi:hypothetical protein
MISRTGDMVHFQFYARVNKLYLTGNFAKTGEWERIEMSQGSNGNWECMKQLSPGQYRFRYVSDDGKWFTDCSAEGLAENPFGSLDSLVSIPDLTN